VVLLRLGLCEGVHGPQAPRERFVVTKPKTDGLALVARAEEVLEQLDARAEALAEVERRSAAMVEGMRHSNFGRS
jgi:hypothetical protein